jgi:hypothetical protein
MGPKIYYRVHETPLLAPNISQMNSVHNFPPYFSKIHSTCIFPSMPKSSTWSLPFGFSNQRFVCISHLYCACYIARPSRSLCNISYRAFYSEGLLAHCPISKLEKHPYWWIKNLDFNRSYSFGAPNTLFRNCYSCLLYLQQSMRKSRRV